MKRNSLLIVMAKQPSAGRTKTRLCPPLSFEQAAAFSEAMLLDTLELGSSLAGVQLAIAITPPQSRIYFERIAPPGTLIFPVEGADIGECLSLSMDKAFASGADEVLALNSDGPSLPREYLIRALELLNRVDVVVGPGEDGGYYLIALKSPNKEIFQGISWSTEKVLEQTLARANDLGLVMALTPTWYDVDCAEEAGRLVGELALLPADRLIHSRHFLETFPPEFWRE